MTEEAPDRPSGSTEPSAFQRADTIQITIEAAYLFVLMLLGLVFLSLIWWSPGWISESLKSDGAFEFRRYMLAALGGLLGGSAFAVKWLHHSVGRGPYSTKNLLGWNNRRLLWRFYVPILSAVIAGIFYAMLDSGLVGLDVKASNPKAYAAGMGFLVGYFSDRAAAKLSEVAYALFGKSSESIDAPESANSQPGPRSAR